MSESGAARIRVNIDRLALEVDAGTTVAAALVLAGASGGARLSVLACQTLCRDGQIVNTQKANTR
ncbi:MAG: Hypothetical, similar to sarcosine oxidase alpha subunit, 2Fe-2S domain [uncultured Paraburkholderia sp.]|nr:MAG: Hypothetical, similar to sarcosine oxidase alpha subunit, 2Fe-2S domain [uncultured Paraburkholderia sp.]